MPRQEAVFASSYAALKAVHAPTGVGRPALLLPGLVFLADRTFAAGADAIEVGNFSFPLYGLPGRTPEHTGIMTTDRVLYVVDIVLDEKTLEHAKLLPIMAWKEDKISKERIRYIPVDTYVLAHGRVTDQILDFIQHN